MSRVPAAMVCSIGFHTCADSRSTRVIDGASPRPRQRRPSVLATSRPATPPPTITTLGCRCPVLITDPGEVCAACLSLCKATGTVGRWRPVPRAHGQGFRSGARVLRDAELLPVGMGRHAGDALEQAAEERVA